jgi:hypothetical protein
MNDRLSNTWEFFAASRMKEDGVPAEPIGHTRHGGLGAVKRTRDLSVSGASGKT